MIYSTVQTFQEKYTSSKLARSIPRDNSFLSNISFNHIKLTPTENIVIPSKLPLIQKAENKIDVNCLCRFMLGQLGSNVCSC